MLKSKALKVLGMGALGGIFAFTVGVTPALAQTEEPPTPEAEQLTPDDSETLKEILDSIDGDARPLTDSEEQALEDSGATLPQGAERQEVEALEASASSCGSWQNASAMNTGWTQSTNYSCSIAGGATSQQVYNWEISNASIGGSVCLQGLGARGAPAGGTLYWHPGGCGADGSVQVDWQNSLHHKSVRAMAATAPVLGTAYVWQ